MSPDEFLDLRNRAEQARNRAERAKGALGSILERLHDEHDCDNIEEGNALLEKLKKESEKDERDLQRGVDRFQEEYREQLGEESC
jgi:hypothetical protein